MLGSLFSSTSLSLCLTSSPLSRSSISHTAIHYDDPSHGHSSSSSSSLLTSASVPSYWDFSFFPTTSGSEGSPSRASEQGAETLLSSHLQGARALLGGGGRRFQLRHQTTRITAVWDQERLGRAKKKKKKKEIGEGRSERKQRGQDRKGGAIKQPCLQRRLSNARATCRLPALP